MHGEGIHVGSIRHYTGNGTRGPTRKTAASSPDATRIYLSEIGVSPLLTADEEKDFARKAQRGDESARQRMIESNLRLVVRIVTTLRLAGEIFFFVGPDQWQSRSSGVRRGIRRCCVRR